MPLTPELTQLLEQAKPLMKSRQYPAAIELYQQGLKLDPDAVEFHESLGVAYTLSNQIDQAIEHFTQVTLLAPRKASAFINLGALYNRLGNYPKAVEMSRKGVSIDRKSADGYYNLGLAYRKQNQGALAVPAYREALRINPQMIVAHQNLGNVFLDMGNYQQAITHFKQALEIDPAFEKARIGLQQAEAAKLGQKTAQNPFGRLVDVEAVERSASAAVVKLADLSEEDRTNDRSNIRSLDRMILRYVREMRVCLKDKLEPMLVDLNNAVMSNVDLGEELRLFHPLTVQFIESARQLSAMTHELAAHHDRMRKMQEIPQR